MCALINLIRAKSRPWMSGLFIYYSYIAARTWVELTHQFDSKAFVARAWMTLTFHGFSAKIGARVVPHGAAGVWISVFKAKNYNHAVIASSWRFVWYQALPWGFCSDVWKSIPIGTGLISEVRHCPGECLGAPAITTCSPWGRGCRVVESSSCFLAAHWLLFAMTTTVSLWITWLTPQELMIGTWNRYEMISAIVSCHFGTRILSHTPYACHRHIPVIGLSCSQVAVDVGRLQDQPIDMKTLSWYPWN